MVSISEIKIGNRYRIDLGDIDGLANSIRLIGLLNPPIVNENMVLIDGGRRLEALKQLGFDECDVRFVNVESLLTAEHDANAFSKLWTPSERVAIAKAIEAELSYRRANNQYKKVIVPDLAQSKIYIKTRDIAASKSGFSSKSNYQEAKTTVDKGAPELIAAMDSGKIAVSNAAVIATKPIQEQRIIVAMTDKEIVEKAKEIRNAKLQVNRSARIEKLIEISAGNEPLSETCLAPIILCDPPWRYEYSESSTRDIENHYPTMTHDELCAMPIDTVALSDCIMFMWATSPKLQESLDLLKAWGFSYRTCAVWDKEIIGMGYYFRQQHELLLVATRGNVPTPLPGDRVSSVIRSRRELHSKKPECVYKIIEAMYPSLPKLEMFCRTQRLGWMSWGNQS